MWLKYQTNFETQISNQGYKLLNVQSFSEIWKYIFKKCNLKTFNLDISRACYIMTNETLIYSVYLIDGRAIQLITQMFWPWDLKSLLYNETLNGTSNLIYSAYAKDAQYSVPTTITVYSYYSLLSARVQYTSIKTKKLSAWVHIRQLPAWVQYKLSAWVHIRQLSAWVRYKLSAWV